MAKLSVSVRFGVILWILLIPGLIVDAATALAPPADTGDTPSVSGEDAPPPPSGGKIRNPGDPSASKILGRMFLHRNEGWKCVGPVTISGYTSKALKLFYFKRVHSIALDGKTLQVRDANAAAGSTGDLQPNKWVCVCEKDSQVLVYTLPED